MATDSRIPRISWSVSRSFRPFSFGEPSSRWLTRPFTSRNVLSEAIICASNSRVIRWILTLLGIVLVLAAAGLAWIWYASQRTLGRVWDVQVLPVRVPDDSATLARGRHLVEAIARCVDCHGEDYGGGVMMANTMFATLSAPNLTRGEGGVGRSYRDEDWVRALRHGLDRQGHALAIMPAEAYQFMSDGDLGAVIAWIRSVPPVNRAWPPRRFGPIARMLITRGRLPLFPAATVDHARTAMLFPSPDTTVAYGAYLAGVGGCTACHNPAMSGGERPGGPPGSPVPPNLTTGGIPQWTEQDLVRALREGRTPDARALDNTFMPWRSSGRMTDDEIHALWLWMRSLPAKQLGEQ